MDYTSEMSFVWVPKPDFGTAILIWYRLPGPIRGRDYWRRTNEDDSGHQENTEPLLERVL